MIIIKYQLSKDNNNVLYTKDNKKSLNKSAKNWYSTTSPVLVDPITAAITLFKSKAAVSTCPTPTAFYPDINFWNYIGSVIKGTITDLTAPLLWKLIFGACCIFFIGYGTVCVYKHAVEIYQIVHFYKQIVGSPELVAILNNKFELLNNFNLEAASQISKLTFNLLDSDDCQIIVKFCLSNQEYSFHGILMDISNSNMI